MGELVSLAQLKFHLYWMHTTLIQFSVSSPLISSTKNAHCDKGEIKIIKNLSAIWLLQIDVTLCAWFTSHYCSGFFEMHKVHYGKFLSNCYLDVLIVHSTSWDQMLIYMIHKCKLLPDRECCLCPLWRTTDYMEIICVYCENHLTHANTVCSKMQSLTVSADFVYGYHWALNSYAHISVSSSYEQILHYQTEGARRGRGRVSL